MIKKIFFLFCICLSDNQYPSKIVSKYDAELYNEITKNILDLYISGLHALKNSDYTTAISFFFDSYLSNIDNAIGEKSYVMYLYTIFRSEQYTLFEEELLKFKEIFPSSQDTQFLEFLRLVIAYKDGYLHFDRQPQSLIFAADNIKFFLKKYKHTNSKYVKFVLAKYVLIYKTLYDYYLDIADTMAEDNILSAALSYEQMIVLFDRINISGLKLDLPIFKAAYYFNQLDLKFKRDMYLDRLLKEYPDSIYLQKQDLLFTNYSFNSYEEKSRYTIFRSENTAI